MIDSHTHLSDEKFDNDRYKIIKEAKDLGVKNFLEILTSQKEWERWKLFEEIDEFYFAFGIHPHYAIDFSDNDISNVEKYLKLSRCVGVGEIGIDLWYHPENLKKQIKLFEIFIEISKKISKPLILHIRNSKDGISGYKIAYDILKANINNLNIGIVHSFSGVFEEAKKFADMGFFIGINATITYPKNTKLTETVEKLGIYHIITETDSPYLPPQSKRGLRNEPKSVLEVLKKISEILKMKLDKTEEIIDLNFLKFLNKPL
ncbi:MAG: TatD family hydrolase [Elusimicrobiales bacterium]|nr:TatD family hydrolase [Elusimicrobiales bacterium]